MSDKEAEITELKTQVAALQEQLEDATDTMSRMESMALQASMNASKQQKELVEALQRLEAMAMTAATGMAKFEKKTDERLGTCEGMLMQAAMNQSKWQKGTEESTMRACYLPTPYPPFPSPFLPPSTATRVCCVRVVHVGGHAHAVGDDSGEAHVRPWQADRAGRGRHSARRQLRGSAAGGTPRGGGAGTGRGHARRGNAGEAESPHI